MDHYQTSSHWISTFNSSLETLYNRNQIALLLQKNLRRFSQIFCIIDFALNIWIFASLHFFLQTIEVESKGFQKMYQIYRFVSQEGNREDPFKYILGNTDVSRIRVKRFGCRIIQEHKLSNTICSLETQKSIK